MFSFGLNFPFSILYIFFFVFQKKKGIFMRFIHILFHNNFVSNLSANSERKATVKVKYTIDLLGIKNEKQMALNK